MQIILYTKGGCAPCLDAYSFLWNKKIQFEERDVLTNPKFFEELQAKSNQGVTPTLDVEGEMLVDCSLSEMKRFLVEKGILKE